MQISSVLRYTPQTGIINLTFIAWYREITWMNESGLSKLLFSDPRYKGQGILSYLSAFISISILHLIILRKTDHPPEWWWSLLKQEFLYSAVFQNFLFLLSRGINKLFFSQRRHLLKDQWIHPYFLHSILYNNQGMETT